MIIQKLGTNQKWIKMLMPVVAFLFSLISALNFYGLQLWASITLSIIVLFVCAVFLMKRDIDFKGLAFGTIVSIFWTFSTYKNNYVTDYAYITGLICTLVFWTILFGTIISYFSTINLEKTINERSLITFTIWASLILMSVWLIYWFSFFPGILNSDAMSEWAQANGYQVLSEWHPLINTYLIKIFSFGGTSPAPFLLVQIVVSTFVLVNVLRRLLKRGMPLWAGYLVVILYAVYPMNGYYMSTMIKDIPYSIILLALFSVFFEVVESNGESLKKPFELVAFAVLMILAALFRKNGLYVVYVIALYCLILLRKKRIILAIAFSIITITGFNAYNSNVLHAAKSPTSEALAIPIQQVASVYANDGNIPAEQRAYFDSITTEHVWRDGYHRESVDSVKLNVNFNKGVIQDNPKKFIVNWFKLFLKNKKQFVAAFMDQTATVWRMYTPNNGYMFGQYRVTLVSCALPLTQRGGITNFYQLSLKNPTEANKLIKQRYVGYKASMIYNKQNPVSFKQFKARILRGYRNVEFSPIWETGYVHLQKMFDVINVKLQKYIARGAIAVLLLLLSICVGFFRMTIAKLTGIIVVPLINLLTLVVSIPATDFRYIYSLLFSVIPIFLYIVTTKHKSGDRNLEHNN